MIEENAKLQGKRNGYVAWQCLKTHCERPPSDLTVGGLNKVWENADFRTVGFDSDTIPKMVVWLANENAKRPDKYKKTEDEIVIKLLSCFDPGTGLGIGALEEYNAPEEERRFWRAEVVAADGTVTPGSRDLLKFQRHYDPLWRTVFARTQDGTRGHQADGAMFLDGDSNDDSVQDNFAYYTSASGGGPAPRARSRPRASGERPVRGDDRLASRVLTLQQCIDMNISRCYACQGHGHLSRDCANPPGVKITIETSRSLLAKVHDASARAADRRGASAGAAAGGARPARGAPAAARGRGDPRRDDPRRGGARGARAYMTGAGFADDAEDGEFAEFYSADEAGEDDEVQLVADALEEHALFLGGSGFNFDATDNAFACVGCDLAPAVAVPPPAPRAPRFVDQFRRLFCWATPPPTATPEPPPPAPAAPPPTQAQPLLPPGLGCGRGPRNTPGAPAVRATAF